MIEGVPNQGDARLLRETYTELYITEGGGGEVNDEHEVRQIERISWRKATQGRPINCNDIFKILSDNDWRKGHVVSVRHRDISGDSEDDDDDDYDDICYDDIYFKSSANLSPTLPYSKPSHRQQPPMRMRTVLTKGVAGIGKTVSVQRFILDWAEGQANQDVDFIFPLPFRELNLMKEMKLCLMDLILHFFSNINDPKILTSSEYKLVFIFDGLDECRLPLDFQFNPRCSDVTMPAPVDVLLTNLIKGNLLPYALLWITTRPAAASHIPPKYVDQLTEIRGFSGPQKEEYFRKNITDEDLASRTITHLKSCRSLFIMCHMPMFCWILATVVERMSDASERVALPRTLTQTYTHFLIVQTSVKTEKYQERRETDEEMIFNLGKLAFQQLEKGNVIFYEEDLRECGIDVMEASVYSGVCTQIFREEPGLYRGKVFSFVHLSIQEFLAALFVFLCLCNKDRVLPDQQNTSQLSALFRAATFHDLHKTAVNLALASDNGHLDLFLRFLLGLTLESNQILLRHLLPQTRCQIHSLEPTVQFIKQRIGDQNALDRRINLFYCLNELNHHAVVEDIDRSSGTLSVEMLLPAAWKTRKFEFKISEEQVDEFDLQKYIRTPEKDLTELLSPDEVFQRLIPVVTSAFLQNCSLTEKSCATLASAARSSSSCLKELDLRGNGLRDAGVTYLADLLNNPQCKLRRLVLSWCSLTEKSCDVLASAARSASCSLKELDLSGNELCDAGVQHLSDLLKNPHCKLEKLVLRSCSLTEKSCAALASVAITSSFGLRELNLSKNKLLDAGVQHLSDLLRAPHCKLEKLELENCSLTEKSCAALATAIVTSTCSLKSLNLSKNDLYDTGVQHLSDLLKNPLCKLEKLELIKCLLTKGSCVVLASAASSVSCSLKRLTLGGNELYDAGVEHLSELLKDPHCKLETLEMGGCRLTERSCAAIASAAGSAFCCLKELILSYNRLQDAGVQHLSDLLHNPNCKLETLELQRCAITEQGCAALASAATSTPCSLKALTLSGNRLYDAGITHMAEFLKSPHCQLEKLVLRWCSLTEKSCTVLASALSSHSCLKELDLWGTVLPHSDDLQHLTGLLKNPSSKLETLTVAGHTFRKKHPEQPAVVISRPLHSDAAELQLTHKAQPDPGTQLLSAEPPKEGPHSNFLLRSCESCVEVPDSSHWVLLEPEVSTEKSISTYSLSSPAGSYECSITGLRWSCAGPVTLQYHFTDWYVFAEQLAQMQLRPAGPLMDIRITSGELEEIHLPHFLCLGGSKAPQSKAVKVLHEQDGGVSLEECELTRHHARILQPSFSLLGLVLSVIDWVMPKVHCELLLFCTCSSPLVLHVYLVPNDPAHIRAIHTKEKPKAVWIDKPGATGPLRHEDSVCVRTSCESEIVPEKINLWPLSTGNYCEVYMEVPDESFDMEVVSSQRTELVWRAKIRRKDYLPPSGDQGQVGSKVAAVFVDENRAELIRRVTEVMPVADELFSQRVIGQETYATIQAAATSQGKMRALYEGLHSAGAQGKLAFYRILQAQQRLLVEELWAA
ncbi:hypothetical protein ACEWY4_024715 [Coilia grayii]|uniref:Uncharacterized protein n=1 Tax=Coilia grayii TaxID=363190 RepID=A0ABD1IVJ6_9TELE